MEDHKPSTTALATARMRSIHTLTDPLPFFSDPWGNKLAPAPVLVAAMSGGKSDLMSESDAQNLVDPVLRASPAYANVILRTRYTEDALLSALSEGIEQYIMIGAGFDSYAIRRPAAARDLEIFEIDHPATQVMKKRRLVELGVADGEKAHFIAADLGRMTMESALSRSSFNFSKKAFLSWLGVTMYLSREANMATFESVAEYCAPGSVLVFSYVDQGLFEGGFSEDAEAVSELKQTVESVGEPFVSGFYPDALENDLRQFGLELEENIDDLQILEQYDPAGINGLRSSAISRIARVRVSEA